MILAEPRRQRAEFLASAAGELGLHRVDVVRTRVETMRSAPVSIISARAVAPIGDILQKARHCANEETCWILPRGGRYDVDMAAAQATWSGMFHVEQSLSEPNAGIVVISRVAAR